MTQILGCFVLSLAALFVRQFENNLTLLGPEISEAQVDSVVVLRKSGTAKEPSNGDSGKSPDKGII